MRKLYHFHKYQGTGNDFVLIDNRTNVFDKNDLYSIKKICDRRFGIGADGLILIEDHPKYNFDMIYLNPDGSQSLCGNGSRCAVMFVRHLGIIEKEACFMTVSGVRTALIKNNKVHLHMGDIKQVDHYGHDMLIDTGSPHYIRFISDLESCDVYQEGRNIRYNKHFKEKGTNVNFVELMDNNEIFVRTYERGVENETLSCGTGVTAAALASSTKDYKSPVNIKVLGGELSVHFNRINNHEFKEVCLVGSATQVFEGKISV